ncbi:spermidine/putrescine ABC transporter substrate-binding protein [Mesorhizobium sp. GR13]|uniref:polyamine ABC transporter substrate-binding protein n=1 Tax=Mesorhizobium sp. GR13 TaxID=2562308 RepID=UPI001485316B|nr:spermidine/putrescine ABC transporter substrate-binding protein [Mesorhizobium sp. GR13]
MLAPARLLEAFSRRRFLNTALYSGAGAVLAGSLGSRAFANQPTKIQGELGIYSFPEYDDPTVLSGFTEQYGPQVRVDAFTSTEEMISKLTNARGTTGYDIVITPAAVVQSMAQAELLEEFDLTRLANFKNLDPSLTKLWFDPENRYSIPKVYGATGFMYDKSKIGRPLKSWADFLDAAQKEASGMTTVADDAKTITGAYFWANDIDWNTTNPSELDACQEFLTKKLAPHIKYFDTYPGASGRSASGDIALMQGFNGDLRMGMLNAATPENWEWVFPETTEIFVDNWSLVKGAPNLDAAYAFLDYTLQPDVALKEMSYTGSNPGVVGLEEAADVAGTQLKELIFFTPEQRKHWKMGEINEARQRLVDILSATKIAAGQ